MADDEFTAFCEREQSGLVGALTLWCGDRFVAEELAQEAFARAYRDWRRVRSLDKPGAWVRRVAVNLATSFFRRQQAERRARRRLRNAADHTYRDPDTAQALVVRQGLSKLPPQQRNVLILRYYLDLPIAEVAELPGRSVTAVTSLTQRAIRALKAELGGTHPLREGDRS